MTYLEWLVNASNTLTGIANPRREAEILLGNVTGKTRTFLMAFSKTVLSPDEMSKLNAHLKRRCNGEPIAYIIGEKEFWSMMFAVSPVTLIPRPDSEKVVELALEYLPQFPSRLLDLGTGTGALAIALAVERSDCHVTGVDIEADAVELAIYNAKTLGVENVIFLQSDWFESLYTSDFAMIVSNPPYIDEHDPHLCEGDLRFEPASALISQENGLSDIKYIIEHAKRHLAQYGWLLIEHGWEQGKSVRHLFKKHGFELVETHQDYGGNERVTLGRWFEP